MGWREGGLGSVGEACLRVPVLLAASLSSQSYAQAGTTRGREESPRDLLTREGSSKGK